jgi:hypothetical protein
MNNMSAEVASAADYADSIRLFTVAPAPGAPHGSPGPTEQQELGKVELKWSPASPKVLYKKSGIFGVSFSDDNDHLPSQARVNQK